MSDLEKPNSGVSRRTVAKAMAWSVPAVALAVPAPAYAASGGPPTVTFGDACKLPGNSCGDVFVKGYIFDVTVTNPTDQVIYFYNEPGYLITFTDTNPAINLFFQAAVNASTGAVIDFPVQLAPGASVAIILNAGENGNSAQQSLTGTISVPWGHTVDPEDDLDGHLPVVAGFSYATTPPVQNPGCQVVLPPNCGN